MLSNTAQPKYYSQFRDAVLRHEIPVCQEISWQMNRIDEFIENPGIFYDEKLVDGWIAYCENELTLTDGSPMHLLDSYKLWGENIWGWWYFQDVPIFVPAHHGEPAHYEMRSVRRRMTNKFYLITGRGSSKSVFASTQHSYMLNVDPTTTHQVATAPTVKQAEEVISPIRTSITRARGPLFQFLTEGSLQNTTGSNAKRKKLASTKDGIRNFLTGSFLETRPMTIDALQGLQVKCSSIDEWLSCDIRDDVMTPLEQGASKVADWLIMATSSEGTVRNGPGDTVKMELTRILKGEYDDPHTAIWWYKLDDISEVAHPSMWVKANPNLGYTVSYETYQREVARAENAPSTKNDMLAKRFGIPSEGQTYFFTYEETLPHRRRTYNGMPCSLGIDLSKGDDFCAFTFLFPLGDGSYGIKARSYISSYTMTKLQEAQRMKYEQFMAEGSLIVMECTVLNMLDVYDDLDRYIEQMNYDIYCVGYDPYNAKDFIDRWTTDHTSWAVEKVIQGVKTESVPLGELKKYAEERMLLFDEDLMMYTMGNSIASIDTNGNRKLIKNRKDKKIDNVSALMDAYVAYKLHREDFI
jgi:phage terminase large subunit-like protein